ncbi:MAG TPA: hypothetical protein VEK56_15155 [Vicinamibacterales bacterium]|nr:hypothetical protein [Vicinamibacterales bacterium]
MANQRRVYAVKKGVTGPAQRAPARESAAAKQTPQQLDARQERMRTTRRRGPELAPAKETARSERPRQVPPTECDDEGGE